MQLRTHTTALSLLLAMLALVACATPYQPKGARGGYTSHPVKPKGNF